MGATLQGYFARRFVGPFLLTLAAFLLAFWIADLVALADVFVNRGVSGAALGRVALLRTIPALAFTIPFAVLVSVLVTLGRLSAQHEILAVQSCGVAVQQLAAPVLWFAALPTAVALVLSVWTAPWSQVELIETLASLAAESPSLGLEAGKVGDVGAWQIEVREVSPDGDDLRGVTLWMGGTGEMVFARRAHLDIEGSMLEMRLQEGVVLADVEDSPVQLRFGTALFRQEVHLEDASQDVDPTAATRTGDLLRLAREASSSRVRSNLQAEFHRRFALPLATPVFALVALALGLVRRADSRSTGILLGLGAVLVYAMLLQLGTGLARAEGFPIGLAVWLPDAVLSGVAVGLGVRLAWGPRAEGRRWRRSEGGVRRLGGWLGGRILDRLMLGSFVRFALASLLVLVVAMFLVDLLDNLKWFMRYESTLAEVGSYYKVRLPVLASRALPLALVAGATLTMGWIASSGELLAMRACGISAARIALPILLLCVLVAPAYHLLLNDWVPEAVAMASRIKQTEIKKRTLARSRVWQRSGRVLYTIEELDPVNGEARGVRFFELDDRGLATSVTSAARARSLGDGAWRLEAPRRHVSEGGVLRPERAPTIVRLGAELPERVETGQLSLAQIAQAIQAAVADGFDPVRFRVDYYRRLAAPLICVLLPALALIFAVGGPPSRSAGQMLVATLLLTLVYMLTSAGGAALGYGGYVPPWVAGWGPPVVLLGLSGLLGPRLSWPQAPLVRLPESARAR